MEKEKGMQVPTEGAGPGIRHYAYGQKISMEEDVAHEFKGHRSISIHDIHSMCLPADGTGFRTRKSVSLTIGAMLNSGQGGTIFLGVNDNGKVIGLALSRYQQDHVEASLEWTLGKFNPPVSDSRYSVAFVPVTSSKTGTLTDPSREHVDNKRRNKPHHVAQPNYCWCDLDAKAQLSLGKLPMLYVVEIHVRPWEPHSLHVPKNPMCEGVPPLPPLHLAEDNACYFRQGCCQTRLCLDDVRRLLVHRVQEHYKLKFDALQQQYEVLKELAQEHGIQLPLQTQVSND